MMEIKNIKSSDTEKILKCWNDEIGFIYPISDALFKQNVLNCRHYCQEGSYCAFDGDDVVGFIIVKKYDNDETIPKYIDKGWISLFFVSEKYRNKGIGSQLLEKGEAFLIDKNVNSISFGSDLDNFFPGIPCDFDNLTAPFLEKRGYDVGRYTHDLLLSDFSKVMRIDDEPFIIRKAESDDQNILLDFLERFFPGRWLYEAKRHIEDNLDMKNYLLAFMNEQLIGFLRVNQKGDQYIAYNITWQDRFTKLAGLGPLGVDPKYRGQGVAKRLILHAINHLHDEGVNEIVIDWTGLMVIYRKYGFEVWKCYQYALRKVKN